MDHLHIADVSSTHSFDFSYPASHINVLSVWQFCRTLVSAPLSHVVECAAPKIGFQGECQAGSDKGIPSALGLVMSQDELQCVLLPQNVLIHGISHSPCSSADRQRPNPESMVPSLVTRIGVVA